MSADNARKLPIKLLSFGLLMPLGIAGCGGSAKVSSGQAGPTVPDSVGFASTLPPVLSELRSVSASDCKIPSEKSLSTNMDDQVLVYFVCVDSPELDVVHARLRQRDKSFAPLGAAITSLLAGPTPAERSAGLQSRFSEKTSKDLVRADLTDNGHATVDLSGEFFSHMEPLGGTAQFAALLRELNSTVFQIPTAKSVVYRLAGNCERFYAVNEAVCTTISRSDWQQNTVLLVAPPL